jgi:hypothetical protein
MLPPGLSYPPLWAVTYKPKDNKSEYPCVILQVHRDDIEPYYTIDILEGPMAGERQTVRERLHSWIDTKKPVKIQEIFKEFTSNR